MGNPTQNPQHQRSHALFVVVESAQRFEMSLEITRDASHMSYLLNPLIDLYQNNCEDHELKFVRVGKISRLDSIHLVNICQFLALSRYLARQP